VLHLCCCIHLLLCSRIILFWFGLKILFGIVCKQVNKEEKEKEKKKRKYLPSYLAVDGPTACSPAPAHVGRPALSRPSQHPQQPVSASRPSSRVQQPPFLSFGRWLVGPWCRSSSSSRNRAGNKHFSNRTATESCIPDMLTEINDLRL
jgi:hypothetical protein